MYHHREQLAKLDSDTKAGRGVYVFVTEFP